MTFGVTRFDRDQQVTEFLGKRDAPVPHIELFSVNSTRRR